MIFSRESHPETAFSHLQGTASAFGAASPLPSSTTTKTDPVARQARWPVSPALLDNSDATKDVDRPTTIAHPFPVRLPI
ncbi:hypothetical protein [Endobacterium cereale]|uniref:hypothetical protein n=1 Tax=Endobacterium cereale TaxID=2663029 RepID=UPI001AD94FAB|nr:hypothetical protein [Endobacterium cereale]MEB2842868.1 hypothetical protein [Endobacterium cereale]